MNEAELIKRALAGDQDACTEIYNNNHPQILWLINKMMHNDRAVSEELAADAMSIVFFKLHTFKGDAKLSTWVHRIAINTVFMHCRGKKPNLCSIEEEMPKHNKDQETVAVEDVLCIEDLDLKGAIDRVTLDSVIRRLPPGYRTVFTLKANGYINEEIAKVLNVHIGTVKSQYHKAIARLRMLLTEKSDARRNNRKASPAVATS